MRRRRVALLTLLLLAGLIAVPVVLTWRQVRQEKLNHALIAAVDRNNTATIRRLLQQGADPNARVLPDDKRPVWRRLMDLWRRSFSSRPTTEETILLKAIRWDRFHQYRSHDNADTVEALIDAGADVNASGGDPPQDRIGTDTYTIHVNETAPGSARDMWTIPLIAAENLEKWRTVKVLLARHADVNATDSGGDTPLGVAAVAANPDVVEALITAGATVNVWHAHRVSALENATVAAMDYPITRVRTTVACLLKHGAIVNDDVILSAKREPKFDKQLIQMLHQAAAKEGKQP